MLSILYLVAYVLLGEVYSSSVLPSLDPKAVKKIGTLYSPLNWPSWLTFALLLTYLLLFEKKHKREIKDKFIMDGKWMHIFYNTRLGMWSPR